MQAVNEILKQVVPIMMIPVNRYLRYLISSATYVKEMGSKMKELNDAEVDVKEHMKRNTDYHLEVPTQLVTGWLEDVEKLNAEVEKVPSDIGGCFSLKIRHKAGKDAFNIIEEIDSVMRRRSLITWTDRPIPLGRVDSLKASPPPATPSTEHNDFPSREYTFMEALKALGENHKSHMIALCGMGGVGKTTMMHKLKETVKEKRMFNYIVEVVVGQITDPDAIQKAVAEYLGIELKETTKAARADKLRNWFEANSNGGKTKILIILDDVWQLVDMSDIGLSPLPNQGIDFKVLLTSRDRLVCTKMGVQVNSIFNVNCLLDVERQRFFRQSIKNSDDDADLDPALSWIGDSIALKCQGLPIAIKTIACNLKGRSKHAWEDALARLNHHDIHKVVHEVFKLSYENLEDEETKSIFLLCGLFPEAFDIPTEELMRYGWGSKLLKNVFSLNQARNRVHTWIDRLIDTNLLMTSDDIGCVKMHDLVRVFALGMFSQVDHSCIVNHGSTIGWPESDMWTSCKRISLSCKGMSEFPTDLRFPNLSILKLMDVDKDLSFPADFYREMGQLQVISYANIWCPFLTFPPQCSTNLRVLHLHNCQMTIDCSSIGNLINLEVLSFVKCHSILRLPSTIGNLKKLRLLELRGYMGLHIKKGVLRNLVKLEELYAKVSRVARLTKHALRRFANLGFLPENGIGFTRDNCNEMAERSKDFSALEIEFHQKNAQLKNMSFKKLERFKISVGCFLDENFKTSTHSSENTLKLVTNKGELLESGINDLFEKTKVLCLSVGDMNDLSDVDVKPTHPHQSSSFYNLRVFVVSKCAGLSYLFTLDIAKALSKLEHLEVDSCLILKELIHNENVGEETIIFSNLKILKIKQCDLLEHIFTFSILESFKRLEKLRIKNCSTMKVVVEEEYEDQATTSKELVVFPHLKFIELINLPDLVGFFLGMNKFVWPSLNEVTIDDCPQMRVFTSGESTAPQLEYINTSSGEHSIESGLNFHVTTAAQHQEVFVAELI